MGRLYLTNFVEAELQGPALMTHLVHQLTDYEKAGFTAVAQDYAALASPIVLEPVLSGYSIAEE